MQKKVLLSLTAAAALHGASMDILPTLNNDSFSQAQGVSGDGSVVVGSLFNGTQYAVIWQDNGSSIYSYSGTSTAWDVSGDGSVVVGSANGQAFKSGEFFYSPMILLDHLLNTGYTDSVAYGVNRDGSVIVGYDGIDSSRSHAVIWTTNGVEALPSNETYSTAWDVSDDGSIIVGSSNNGGFLDVPHAVIWKDKTLTFTSSVESEAYGVSGDGSVVVGSAGPINGRYAVMWTNTGVMTVLLSSSPTFSEAYAANSDGSVIVGVRGDANWNDQAFRWTANGAQSLAEWLGLDLSGWSKTVATDVNDDGSVVVGYGKYNGSDWQAFIARGQSGLISLADFSNSLGGIRLYPMGLSMAETGMHGAHGHPGSRRAMAEDESVWVAGDLSSDNRHDTKDRNGLAEIGYSKRLSDTILTSIAIGKTWGDSDLLYGGNIDSNGKYIAIDTDIKLPTALPLYATLTYLYGQNDLDVTRGYDNGGSLDSSYGTTDQTIQALRARLQYQGEMFYPYVEINNIKVKTDGYTETGGGFPAIFDANKESVTDWRAGFDANYKIDENNILITTLEGVHRMDKEGSGVSGQIIGLSAFEFAGRAYDRNWVRGTLGIEHKFQTGKFTLTLNASSEGEDPQAWAGFNYSIGF